MNVAVTLLAASIDTTHAPVPVHAPDQPRKNPPVDAVAANDTDVPCENDAEHVTPQRIPTGADDTTPLPVPAFTTVRE